MITDECIESSEGRKRKNGYYYVCNGGGRGLAHRLVYSDAHGAIPKGKLIRHKCDNPSCVNLEHLEIGTHADNMRDMRERGRATQSAPFGLRNGRAKLSDDQILEIRALYATGIYSQSELAGWFSVRQDHISRIVNMQRRNKNANNV